MWLDLLRIALAPVARYFERFFVLSLGRGRSPPPPDYTPVANASREAAAIGAALGREQLAEARRQYVMNMEVARPIIDAQTRTMNQAFEQGDINFQNFQNEGRPLQRAMRDIADGRVPESVQRQMEAEAARSMADVAANVSNQRQQSQRSLARMGVNPNSGRFAAMQNEMDLGAASAKAGAANRGRNQALDRAYARKGDVLNTFSGLASSAPQFYSASTTAGNSAMTNQMAPGGALLAGMHQGAGTTMDGRRIGVQGLGNVLQAQTNWASNNQGDSMGSMLGGLGGAATGIARLWAGSDPRIKHQVMLVGVDRATGLGLYEFAYIADPQQKRYIGVMADEVQERFPDAVAPDPATGYLTVNYEALGLEMKEVA